MRYLFIIVTYVREEKKVYVIEPYERWGLMGVKGPIMGWKGPISSCLICRCKGRAHQGFSKETHRRPL